MTRDRKAMKWLWLLYPQGQTQCTRFMDRFFMNHHGSKRESWKPLWTREPSCASTFLYASASHVSVSTAVSQRTLYDFPSISDFNEQIRGRFDGNYILHVNGHEGVIFISIVCTTDDTNERTGHSSVLVLRVFAKIKSIFVSNFWCQQEVQRLYNLTLGHLLWSVVEV